MMSKVCIRVREREGGLYRRSECFLLPGRGQAPRHRLRAHEARALREIEPGTILWHQNVQRKIFKYMSSEKKAIDFSL